jgi:hypothetical protein
LGNNAVKGQTIAGVSFDKDGKFHRQGINISFGANVRDSSVSGTTTFSLDDKKMNNSNAYPALRKMNAKRGYTQHWQERNVNRAMERIGVPVMQQYYKSKGVSKPKSAILKSVYGFIN